MKTLMRIGLVTLAAVALVTVAFACDSDKAGDKASAGCAHEKMAKAGCNHEGKEAGCNHEAKAEGKDEAGGCPFHSKATDSQRAALQKGQQVTLVGRVVCAACDLKQAKDCKSMFKTDGGDLYAIVGNDAFEKLAGETKHGEKKVEVVGTSAKDSGESIILLASYKVVS